MTSYDPVHIAEEHYWMCYLCGDSIEGVDLHIDHVWPRSLGGSDCRANLRPTHSWCNLSKKTRVWTHLLVRCSGCGGPNATRLGVCLRPRPGSDHHAFWWLCALCEDYATARGFTSHVSDPSDIDSWGIPVWYELRGAELAEALERAAEYRVAASAVAAIKTAVDTPVFPVLEGPVS